MSISEKYLSEGDQKSLSCVVAIALGGRAAMVLQEIHYWTGIRKRERNKSYFFQGHYWMWNSYKSWQRTFPFIPEPSLKKIILELERESVIISAEFNRNKGNRTKWYRIDYGVLCELLIPAEAIYNSYFEDAIDPPEPPCDPLEPPCDPLEPPCDPPEPPCDPPEPPCDPPEPPCDPPDPLCLVINLSDQSSEQPSDTDKESATQKCDRLEKIQNQSAVENLPLPEKQEKDFPATNQVAIEDHSSAAAPTKLKKPRKAKTLDIEALRSQYQIFLEVFNRDAPEKWERFTRLTVKQIEGIDQFVNKFGDRAIEIFQKGLMFAKTNRFYSETVDWDIAQYLTNKKPQDLAEKYDASTSPVDRPTTPTSPSQERMSRNYARFANELGIGA